MKSTFLFTAISGMERFSNTTVPNGTFYDNFVAKYSWNIEMGRSNCPTTTDQRQTYFHRFAQATDCRETKSIFNTDFNSETDDPLLYTGVYYADEGVGSNIIDYAKVNYLLKTQRINYNSRIFVQCIYVINGWYEKHSHANIDCSKHITTLGSKGPIKESYDHL